METIPPVRPGDRVVEIVHRDTGEIGHRSIVTGWTDRELMKLANGVGINLDWQHWTVREREIER